MQRQAKITSKRQLTVPQLQPVKTESPFAKYRGIGNPGIASGRKAIIRWVRELRGR